MSLYYDSGVLVKLYVRGEFSDAVARSLAERREAFVINNLHDIEMRNALRLSGRRHPRGPASLGHPLPVDTGGRRYPDAGPTASA